MRKRFILLVLTAPIGVWLLHPVAASSAQMRSNQPRAILLFIGDGMGEAHRRAGRWMVVGTDGQLVMNTLPAFGWSITANADGSITDSAAAATAMATGAKTFNGQLSIDSDMRDRPTILEQAQKRGWSVGLVTTVQMAHATPAAFAAHEINRHNYTNIALQMLEHNINVLLAGGEDDFLPQTETGCYPQAGNRSDERNLIAEAIDQGYTYVCTASELAAVDFENTTHLLGLFGDEEVSQRYEPSLEEMTTAAIKVLAQDPDGFFLMVEGGQIDWAGHANQGKHVINDVIELDAAVAQGLHYAQIRANTLIIVTADHETGGMSVDLESSGNPDEDGPFQMPDGTPFYLNWTTINHTGVNVPVTAFGPSSEALIGTYENTHIYEVMHQFLDDDIIYLPNVQNPSKARETLKYQVKSNKIDKPL